MKSKAPERPLLVSIACITYNQAKYIRQTLDSFLMQKTDFLVEILINDDSSNDGTAEIIKEYQKKYPKIIKPVFHEKNLYSQGVRGMYVRFLLPKAKGKYIALCEGDDYWTDPYKLQIQVDYLEKRPDHALCFHPVKVFFEDEDEKAYVSPDVKENYTFTTADLIKHNFINTNSVMYRKTKKESSLRTDVMPGDWYMHLYYAQFGKIGFINRVMSAYRRYPGGIWWDSFKNADKIWRDHGLTHLALYSEMLNMYGKDPEYKKIIYGSVQDAYVALAGVDKKYNETLLNTALSEFPELIKGLVERQQGEVNDKQREIDTLTHEAQVLNHLLKDIKASRIWKTRNKLAKLVRKKAI